MSALQSVNVDIPVIILSIIKTENKDLLAFDIDDPKNLMPYSGTIVKVGNAEYLLFNNTRYGITSKPKNKGYNFPIKIALSSSVEGMFEDIHLVEELIDQVYQFSRMYWKSTDQQSLPVTIKYPAMVAEIFPHFKHEKLADYGKTSFWFL
jgi:hypothetical protein